MASTTYACTVPHYHDPGAPTLPRAKLYLVIGPTVEFPGAYASWPTADALYKASAGSTLKVYSVAEQPLMQAAWRAFCGRSGHVFCSPPPPDSPEPALPVVVIDSRSPSPTLVSPPARLLSTPPPPHVNGSRGTGSIRTYAVHSRGVGQVFSCSEEASEHFRSLQLLGESPVLFIGSSLDSAVFFVEQSAAAALPNDIEERDDWIAQEQRAREVLVQCDRD
ncbi:hypothetical protein B0H15DRAFT_954378 [Mycena belliarum]|uniref:Uncharacterized protein n=1 Tax=Mycena belliarum TaxID=1033014 RepID=A0AAD6TXD9_9AGAR|nr:hypothetical protein B0H15DRAFT_954378 [Mycena belliae]